MRTKRNSVIKKIVAFSLAFAATFSSFANVPAKSYAQEQSNEKFPYTIYTDDAKNGITLNFDGVTVNGDIQTNGTFVNNSLYGNSNGNVTENANTEMIHIHNKLQEKYFANAERYSEDYSLAEMNMNINKPLYVVGVLDLKGNTSLNSAMGAITDVNISGETINANNSVIYSKFGNITIDCNQVSVNGLIYAPFGTVSVDCSNFNMNGIIIAKNLVINGMYANINYNHSVAEFVGVESEELNWSEEDLKYLPDYLKGTTYDVKNPNSAITKVTVALSSGVSMEGTTTIKSIMNVDKICTDVVGLVGEPFSIESTCAFDKATITFNVDKSKLGDTAFEDLLFLWYDEANCKFVELDTVCDAEKSTVSTETTHFSKYMVVDKKAWFEAWAVQLDYNKKNPGAIGAPNFKYDTVLVIDCSGSMSSYDPITTRPANSSYEAQRNKSCKRIDAAMNFVKTINNGDRVGLVLFESGSFKIVDLTDEQDTLELALQNVKSSGGTNFNIALNSAYSLFDEQSYATYNERRIIFLTDGEATLYDSYIQTAKDKSIKIYTVGLGSSYRYDQLKDIAATTGGEFFEAFTAEDLLDIYTNVGIGDDFDKTDTDKDGLYDAVESVGIRIQNGRIIYGCDPTDDDTDDDGLKDGVEIDPVIRVKDKMEYPDSVPEEGRQKVYYFHMNSNPVEFAFRSFLIDGVIDTSDVVETADGFTICTKSLADIFDAYNFPDKSLKDFKTFGLARNFDDWYIYHVENHLGDAYSLIKLREREIKEDINNNNVLDEGEDTDGDGTLDAVHGGVSICFREFDISEIKAYDENYNYDQFSLRLNNLVQNEKDNNWLHSPVLTLYFGSIESEAQMLIPDLLIQKVLDTECQNGNLTLVIDDYINVVDKKEVRIKPCDEAFETLNKYKIGNTNGNQEIYDATNNTITLSTSDFSKLTLAEKQCILSIRTCNPTYYSIIAEIVFHAVMTELAGEYRHNTPINVDKDLVTEAAQKAIYSPESIHDMYLSGIVADMAPGEGYWSSFNYKPYDAHLCKKVRNLYGNK